MNKLTDDTVFKHISRFALLGIYWNYSLFLIPFTHVVHNIVCTCVVKKLLRMSITLQSDDNIELFICMSCWYM